MAVDMKKLIQGYIKMTNYLMTKSLNILKNTPKVAVGTYNKINKLVESVTSNTKNPKEVAKGLPGGDLIGEILSL